MSPITVELNDRTKPAEDLLRLRNLTPDLPNRRYLMRFSLDLGPSHPVKRVTVALRTDKEDDAIRQREAIFDAILALGLTVKGRSLVRKGGRQ